MIDQDSYLIDHKSQELVDYLKPFYETVYNKLDPSEQAMFEELLKVDDQKLYAWLRKPEACSDLRWQMLIYYIRGYANHYG